MANFIIKPAAGDTLKLQDEGGDDAISISTTGVSTIANATITAGTFPAGHIVQVVAQSVPADHSGAGNLFSDQVLDGFSTTITPSSASNKLYLICQLYYIGANTDYIYLTFERAIAGGATTNNIGTGNADGGNGIARQGGGSEQSKDPATLTFLDSPNTTSAVTYQVRFRNNNDSSTVYVGGGGENTMTIMEIVV